MRTAITVPVTKGKSSGNCPAPTLKHRLMDMMWSLGPAFQRWADSHMTEKKLSPQRLRILGLLNDQGPQIMSLLKEELGVTATNITALIDTLEADGLVARKPHPTDRRATVIELTPKASCEVALGCSAYKDRVSDLFTVLNESERKELMRLLDKVWGGLREKGVVD